MNVFNQTAADLYEYGNCSTGIISCMKIPKNFASSFILSSEVHLEEWGDLWWVGEIDGCNYSSGA